MEGFLGLEEGCIVGVGIFFAMDDNYVPNLSHVLKSSMEAKIVQG